MRLGQFTTTGWDTHRIIHGEFLLWPRQVQDNVGDHVVCLMRGCSTVSVVFVPQWLQWRPAQVAEAVRQAKIAPRVAGNSRRDTVHDDAAAFFVLTETKFCILPYTCLGSVLAPPDQG
jgi:hypothetical protein